MVEPVGEAHLIQGPPAEPVDLVAIGVDEGQLDVLEGAGAREQMEGLEHEPDATVAEAGLTVRVEAGDVLAVEEIAPRRRGGRAARGRS